MSQRPVPTRLAVMANSSEDYARLGLSPTSIEPWEDGARTDDSAGTYEWWYFDAHLADGAKLVVVFMNKDIAAPLRRGRQRATTLTCGLATTDSRVTCTRIGSRRLPKRYRSMSR